jgi:formamidopyrimidine-DNA glycosylase
MPELPEVETIRRSLLPGLVGQTITGVRFGAFPGVVGAMDPGFFTAVVIGRLVTDIRRRGKYLLIDLDDGSGIEVHLRMTGNLTLCHGDADPIRFEYLALTLSNGSSLRYSDQRKFGRVLYRADFVGAALEQKLGPEPLSSRFTADYLTRRLRNRTAPIKALILDQRIIAGVGNIYADEALFRSRLHPLRAGGSLTEHEITSLVRSIRHVLRAGIENRGTSFSSYRDGYGEAGANQFRLRIYGRGRSGEPCLRCGGPLTIVQAGGRSSHVCVRCQPLP